MLNLYVDVAGGLLVHPPIVARHLDAELPFLASEAVLMEAVKAGGDRQDLHERIRVHSVEAKMALASSKAQERLQEILRDAEQQMRGSLGAELERLRKYYKADRYEDKNLAPDPKKVKLELVLLYDFSRANQNE